MSQFLNSPCVDNLNAVNRILKYIKGFFGKGRYMVIMTILELYVIQMRIGQSLHRDRKSISEYCVFIGVNLISWKNKKHVLARSSAETEYRTMTLVACELIWLKQLRKE